MTKRLEPQARKDQLLDAAVKLAAKGSYTTVTRDAIAKEAGVSAALVSNYWGTMTQIRRAIMRAAIEREIVSIVAQGLADRDGQAAKASPGLKAKAAAHLAA